MTEEQQRQRRSDWSEYERLAPAVIRSLRTLGQAVEDSGLDVALTELLKIRVSQLNGCAFCLQFHLNRARKLGMDPVRLDLVATWHDAGVFSRRECAALAWAEALTLMSQRAVPDVLYVELCAVFSELEVMHLTAAVGAINAWNRIAGGLQFAPPVAVAAGGVRS